MLKKLYGSLLIVALIIASSTISYADNGSMLRSEGKGTIGGLRSEGKGTIGFMCTDNNGRIFTWADEQTTPGSFTGCVREVIQQIAPQVGVQMLPKIFSPRGINMQGMPFSIESLLKGYSSLRSVIPGADSDTDDDELGPILSNGCQQSRWP